jgi:hypothetical protein
MEEMYDALQRCYGSVRYRRSIETRPAPIPLQKVKLRPSGPYPTEPGANVPTPPGLEQLRAESAGGQSAAQPILLTRRKDRKRTLPLDIGIGGEATPATPPAAAAPPTSADPPVEEVAMDDEWVEVEPELEDEDWTDRDLDGTGGSGRR